MAVEYKEITQLEKLDTLADGSYILVVEDGTAKLISKEKAKFGGGGITTYRLVDTSPVPNSAPSGGSPVAVQSSNSEIAVQAITTQPSYTLIHEDGTLVTAQEVYDAYQAGSVRVKHFEDSQQNFAEDGGVYAWESVEFLKAVSSTELFDPTDVVFCGVATWNQEITIGTVPGWMGPEPK